MASKVKSWALFSQINIYGWKCSHGGYHDSKVSNLLGPLVNTRAIQKVTSVYFTQLMEEEGELTHAR
jgi:hypothetical protein